MSRCRSFGEERIIPQIDVSEYSLRLEIFRYSIEGDPLHSNYNHLEEIVQNISLFLSIRYTSTEQVHRICITIKKHIERDREIYLLLKKVKSVLIVPVKKRCLTVPSKTYA